MRRANHHRPNHRFTAWFALLAFAAHLLLPFFATYAPPATGTTSDAALETLAELYGEKIFICTPRGYEWVSIETWQKRQAQQQQSPTHQTGYFCGMCFLAAHGLGHVIPQPMAALASAGLQTLAALDAWRTPLIPGTLAHPAYDTRAPPYVS